MDSYSIPPDIFETERILGRKPVISDAQAMFDAYATDPDVTRFLVFKPYKSPGDLKVWLSYTIKEWDRKPGLMYLLFNREKPDELIGSFSIGIDHFKSEVGYLVARPFWGQGYATEVLRHWIDWSLTQPGIYRIGAVCDIDNPASAKVMLKAGMAYEGILKRWGIHPNISYEPRDVYSYAKTR